MPRLNQFFAVTTSSQSASMYRLSCDDLLAGSAEPVIEKVALRGPSSISVGGRLQSGPLVAICSQIIPFIPEGGGLSTYERNIVNVNTRYWISNTSRIVALFLDEEAARRCFESEDLKPGDVRWINETNQVLDLIGPDHPKFVVVREGRLGIFEDAA